MERVPKYPFEVHHRIRRDERDDYARIARSLVRCADVVSLQFDEAIWGGQDGGYVLDFVRALGRPSVATLHTIHRKPTPAQREVLDELIASVDSVVVTSSSASNLLVSEYGIGPTKLSVIPYGVPDLPMRPVEMNKATVGLEGREHVIVSVGSIRPDSGHELLVDAMPSVVAQHPDAILAIVGAADPVLAPREAEACRVALLARAAANGIATNVRFVDGLMGRVELTRWVQAADVFVAPTVDLDSTVSGALTHAMAAGRAIVSTRSPYAQELLADGRGMLVPPAAASLGSAIARLLADPGRRAAMGALAHERARPMAWAHVARDYELLLERTVNRARTSAVLVSSSPAADAAGPRSGHPHAAW